MMKSNILHYALVLGIITVTIASILAGVYALTKDRIAEAVRQDFLAGLRVVLPEFDNAPDEDIILYDNSTIYTAKIAGEIVGYACVGISKNGYGGQINVLVGTTTTGRVSNVTVLSHKETPGLGDKITASEFLSKFKDAALNKIFSVKKDGGDIDQFSGATISPRAVCEAVNNATKALSEGI
jgi:electron transport complex protein RnfG